LNHNSPNKRALVSKCFVSLFTYLFALDSLTLSSVSQAVKDLIEELVVENQIEKDKIGAGTFESIFTASFQVSQLVIRTHFTLSIVTLPIGNYFWCFPSKALTIKTNALNRFDQDIARAQSDISGKREHLASSCVSERYALDFVFLPRIRRTNDPKAQIARRAHRWA